MPGVADQIRKTQLKQEHTSRQNDMQELLKMVQEGRLHEADSRQLENLKLALELNKVLDSNTEAVPAPVIDPEQLAAALKQAVSEGMAGLTINAGGGDAAVVDTSRPQMKHTSLSNLTQDETKVAISHKDTIGKEVEGEESTDKLEKLRKLKGNS